MADGYLLSCEIWTEAEGGWAGSSALPSSCSCSQGVTGSPAKPPCRWGHLLWGNSKGTAGNRPRAHFFAGGAAMGWDLCRHGMLGPTFPFSFPRHPPNLFVLPCCLPGRPRNFPCSEHGARNFPCSEHGASHLHLMSVFVLVLAPVLAGIVMQPSPGVLPTPELSLLAAVAGGMGAGGPRGCGVGVLSCTRLAGGAVREQQDGSCQHRGKSN